MLIQKRADGYLGRRRRMRLDITGAGVAAAGAEWRGGFITPPHSRLYFLIEGSFFIVGRDGERREFSEGQVCLIPSGYSYSFGCEKYMRQAYFHLRLSCGDGLDMLARCERPLTAEFSGCERLWELLGSERRLDTLRAEGEVYRALDALLPSESAVWNAQSYSDEIERAVGFITENTSVALSLSEVAGAAHISESTLSKKFRREVGMSVGEYIDAQVMLRAEEMLSGKASVGEISAELGFCDQFYFSRRFKEKYGISPNLFRKKGTP